MKISKIRFVSVLVLLSAVPGTVLAQEQQPPEAAATAELSENNEGQMRNCMDPNYVYTEEELRALAIKEKQAERYAERRIGIRYIARKVLPVGTWKEPDKDEYNNYCGPGATQVALDARLPASQVPDIDTLGEEENIDPNSGVFMSDIQPVLNTRLSTDWYWCSGSGSAATLYNHIVLDLENDYALVTGCRTDYMPNWTVNANHIVTVYGYFQPSSSLEYIYYTETASPSAGYHGPYRQTALLQSFWDYVQDNDVQAW